MLGVAAVQITRKAGERILKPLFFSNNLGFKVYPGRLGCEAEALVEQAHGIVLFVVSHDSPGVQRLRVLNRFDLKRGGQPAPAMRSDHTG